ncbi:YbaB/EbfC family nucleoid-associated protein [Propioniciclava flava]|uniref:Nucleoid-associated protein C1706_13620 n=1 Tax=Propioniciclava flava TaxID=2072026 RepID=A0A4V1Q726_9ACTN|nr:YbaB/EbfC family nucleoid-associated protein [Propioniciclava flava]RXW31118.1 nucleoid-associated protein, YbaB/EbfC family [Propioniciclava flava]
MSMFGTEGGGFDINALLAQAQQMQQQMASAQAELAATTVEGTAGGDLVRVTMTGEGDVTQVVIAPAAIDPEDPETLGDLVVAALRDASNQVKSLAAASMPQIPNLPF